MFDSSHFSDVRQALEALEASDRQVGAFVQEAGRRQRLADQCRALLRRGAPGEARAPLFGVPIGVKDLFRVDGLPTRAGSQLPAEAFDGPEASVVRRMTDAGALVLGKTTTDEFAYADPPETRNPRALDRSPGGSSAGSAAAVAAGFCSLALGTQTSRSLIAPAAWCGVVGFKPSLGRVPQDGIVLLSHTLDTAGLLARDLEILERGLGVLVDDFGAVPRQSIRLGIPTGKYLAAQPDRGWRAHYDAAISALRQAGIGVESVDLGWDARVQEDYQACMDVLHGEMARLHRARLERWGDLYRPRSRAGIARGEQIDDERLKQARGRAGELRQVIDDALDAAGVDGLVSPAQPAPPSLLGGVTGWGSTTIPWSFAGLPCASIPWGTMAQLPAGLQLIAPHGADEKLLGILGAVQSARDSLT